MNKEEIRVIEQNIINYLLSGKATVNMVKHLIGYEDIKSFVCLLYVEKNNIFETQNAVDGYLARSTMKYLKTSNIERGRWHMTKSTIIQIADRYLEFVWYEGLTEYQENEYDCKPVEVKRVVKMVKRVSWEPIEK